MVGQDSGDDSRPDLQKEDLVDYVKDCIEKIARIKDKNECDIILFEMLHNLTSLSDTYAEEDDYYEAAGILCSAAYYLEEFYNNYAKMLYENAIKFYILHIDKLVRNGNIKEASNVSVKIADIYQSKILSTSDEEKYVDQAIEFVKQELELMIAYDSAHDLALLFQKLGTLYDRVHRFKDAIGAYINSLKFAKKTRDLSLISNGFQNLSNSYLHLNDIENGQKAILDGMDYFSNLASKYEQSGELLSLSQIFQIMKRYYGLLRDKNHFNLYSRKEAMSYVSLAKDKLIGDLPSNESAAYYRAAGLCYKDTNKNNIEAGTCFILAGNYYKNAEKYVKASICYTDAAEMFESLENYKQAYEFYIKSAEISLKARNNEVAIENYIQAIDIYEKANIKNDNAVYRLIELLEHYAEVQLSINKSFIAATMFLEAAYYYYQIKKQFDHQFTSYIQKAEKLYYQCGSNPSEIPKHSDRVYALVLSVLCNYLLNNMNRVALIQKEINPGKSTVAKIYEKILTLVTVKAENEDVNISMLEPKERNTYSQSEELKKLIYLINIFR